MEQITERDAQLLEFIPEEIMFEILTRLPVRSLLKFRCVCKSWNSLISSPNFINAHLERHAMDSFSDYILVKSPGTKSLYSAKDFIKYMNLDLRSSDTNLDYNTFYVYGSCNGLLCILVASSLLFIWNPSIRKIKRVPQGLYQDADFSFKRIGFGFNQKNDYQVVEIIGNKEHMYKVEVYSFRLDSWRELRAVPPVSFPLSDLDHCSIDANGVVYWIFRRYDHSRRFILSFHMNNEVFQKIEFPDIPLHRGFRSTISFQEFEKSLSLINLFTYDHDCREDDDNRVRGDSHCDIWVMGLNNTWKKTSTILLPQVNHHPLRYIRAGRPLRLTKDGLYIATFARVYLDECSFKSRAIVDDHISREAKEITTVEVVEVCRPTPVEVLTYKESLELLNIKGISLS